MSSRNRSRSTNAGATDKRKSSASPQVVRQTSTTPSTSANKTPVPSAAKKSLLHVFCTEYWGALVYYLGFGFGDSLCRNMLLPRVPLCYVVNAFKGATLFFCCFLMHYFDNYAPTNCVYTALHGSYGVLWCLKELWCPDTRFQQPVPLGSALMAAVFCGLYWLAPVVLISRRVSISSSEPEDLGVEEPPYNKVAKFRDAACVFTYVIGVCMMLVADTHKFIALKYADSELVRKKKLLISDGIFYSNRNPNYLGEMLLYGSFAVVSLPIDVVLGKAWFSSSRTTEPVTERSTTSTARPLWIELSPLFVLAFAWLGLFSVNMFQKESSLMKKPGYAEYKKRSWLFLPKLM